MAIWPIGARNLLLLCYKAKYQDPVLLFGLVSRIVQQLRPQGTFPRLWRWGKARESALGTRLGLIRRTSYAWPGLTVNSADGKNPITQRPFRTDVLNVFKPGRRNLSPARAWKLSSRLFSRLDWLPLGLRGWEQCGVYSTIMNEKPGTL